MRFLLALIVLFLSIQTQAAVSKTSSEASYADHADVRAIASASEANYETLASRLCLLYLSSNNLVEDSKKAIIHFIKQNEPNYPNPSVSDVINLLNKNKNSMICVDGKHFINFAIEKGYYNEIIDELFYNELYTESDHLDFNAITMTLNPSTGLEEPMTVLDYIDKVALKDPAISGGPTATREIKEIRELLIEEFGAKPFSELSEAEIAEWEAFQAQR